MDRYEIGTIRRIGRFMNARHFFFKSADPVSQIEQVVALGIPAANAFHVFGASLRAGASQPSST